MGLQGEKSTPQAGLQLRDELVNSIYAMVENEREWPELLLRLDEYFSRADLPPRKHDTTPLLAHMERASLLIDTLSELRMKTRYTDKVLDRVPMGIALIDPECNILSINSRAHSLLDSIGAKHRDGHLEFPDAGTQKQFRKVIEQVSGEQTPGAPLSIENMNLWVSRHGSGSTTRLALYLGHRTSQNQIQFRRLMEHYGLTEKEARLTARLCDGFISLEEAADSLHIGIGTARSHLKRVFSKTGVQRQADLIKLVLSNPILTLQYLESSGRAPAPHTQDSQLLHLSSGRTISWAEYGDPKGSPVLFCHAITGCRLLIPQDCTPLTRHGIRLIVPDRAGYGLSTPASAGSCMQQWLEDIELFMACLGIRSCPVIGHSAGGGFALDLASIYPERVEKLILLGSVLPLGNRADIRHLLPINRVLIQLGRKNPTVARTLLALSMQVLLKKAGSYFGLVNKDIAHLDSAVLEDPIMRKLLDDSFRETTRQGSSHMQDEMLYLATCWRGNPDNISCPITLWHGDQDKLTPRPVVEKFQQRLGKRGKLHWVEDAGYFLHFHQWHDIIRDIHA